MFETVGVLGSSGTIGRCVAKKLLDAGVMVGLLREAGKGDR